MGSTLILGIDPGSRRTGWGVVRHEGRRVERVDSGTIVLLREPEISRRLALLHSALDEVVQRIQPEAVAVEDVFTSRNARSALLLGQARGVCLAAAGLFGLPVHAYPPATVKQAVCGHGRADKAQVGRMVQVLLSLARPAQQDEADALAVALCHAFCHRGAVQLAAGARAGRGHPGRRGR